MNLGARISADWNEKNQLGVRRALERMFQSVDALCDPDRHPFFDTPNRVFALGYNRWIIADYWMEQACKLGWIEGIKPVWEKNMRSTGPIRTLVLHGAHTKVSVVHLSAPDESPRESRMRYEGRVDNESCPYLIGWDEAAVTRLAGPINLVLVYGDKAAEFAFLRAFNNSEDLSSYRDVTNNLFALTRSIQIDGESVSEIKIDLMPPDQTDEDDQNQSPGSVAK
ncbi:MAG: hypothetical protein H7343_05290 [Undibacterium sp.]|nr:hypothetical protein [Opitutaceae bacterium]